MSVQKIQRILTKTEMKGESLAQYWQYPGTNRTQTNYTSQFGSRLLSQNVPRWRLTYADGSWKQLHFTKAAKPESDYND